MSEVNINTEGYIIMPDAISGVVNPFLDLADAAGEKFYFLEGQYDQVVLEKIYNILNSLNTANQEELRQAKSLLDDAQAAYDTAAGKLAPLETEGVYGPDGNEIACLIEFLEDYYSMDNTGIFPSTEYNNESCKSVIGDAYANTASLICDLLMADISLTDPTFTGHKDLLAFGNQLDADTLLDNLKTTLEEKKKALENNYYGLEDEIMAYGKAINAIDDYKEKYNLDKTYGTNESLIALQESLIALQIALNGISSSFSVTKVIFAITNRKLCDEAVAAINVYEINKSNTALEDIQKKLKKIDEISGNPFQSSIKSLIDNISVYFGVNGAVGEIRAALDTFRTTQTASNLEVVVTKLQAMNTMQSQIPSAQRTSYYDEALVTAIDAAVAKTADIRSLLAELGLAVTQYNGLTSLTAASDAFWEIEYIIEELFDDIKGRYRSSTTLTNTGDRFNDCEKMIGEISGFNSFYQKLSSLIAFCQNDKIKALLTDYEQNTYYDGTSLKEPLAYDSLRGLCNILNGYLNSISENIKNTKEVLDEKKEAYDRLLKDFDGNANVNDLFNLCMMASTPKPQSDGAYRLVTGIQRTIDSNGNYTYALKYSGSTISKAKYEESFSKEDGYKHYSLPYIALAIMYEKVGIQQMVLVEQLKQVEKINDAIRTNNTALKLLSWLYDKVYAKSTTSGTKATDYVSNSSTPSDIGMDIAGLDAYLEHTVKGGNLGRSGSDLPYIWDGYSFIYTYRNFNRDGDVPENGKDDTQKTQNIDVKEQATLTMISNKQDAVRIYGDQLSTDSQLMTTKMSQYMQNSNACVSAATQVVKSIGDYLKTIVSNIR
ncbi:MAG: hypothetical protein LBD34_01005 [Puniceicoccales bacterium]|jgi:hypothetical protein|nr:hypothetical protein [Puniceicoccales bacterium]